MVITNEFYFRGWLPAGLVINSRLLTSQPDADSAVLTPIINSDPGTTWPVHQPRPVFPIAQATDVSAIVLKDPVPESTLVMLPLGDWYGPGTPYILAINTWYDGTIQSVTGGDVPAVRIIMAEMHLYLSMTEMDPGNLPDVCVGEMPARILVGKRGKSALFLDSEGSTIYSGVMGWGPLVKQENEQMVARYMKYLTIKQAHTAGLAMGVLRDSGSESNNQPDCYLKCALVSGQVTPPVGAGKIHYYGIVPVARASVQPIFYVGGGGVNYEIRPLEAEALPNLLSMSTLSDSSLAVVDEYGDDQVVHYN